MTEIVRLSPEKPISSTMQDPHHPEMHLWRPVIGGLHPHKKKKEKGKKEKKKKKKEEEEEGEKEHELE